MKNQLVTETKEMAELAEHLENRLGTAGGAIVVGLLINEGLHAVAEAIRTVGDVEGSIKQVANAILRAK